MRIEAIEQEFSEPIHNVILGLREQHLTWKDVAGCLEVSLRTLQGWRKSLGMGYDGIVRYSVKDKLTDIRAREKGYVSLPDAIRDLKLNHKMTQQEIAEYIGVSERSISVYNPPELKGMQNLSEAGRRRHSEVAKENNKRMSSERHPWKKLRLLKMNW